MAYEKDLDRKPRLSDEDVEAACNELLTTGLGAPGSDVDEARTRNLEFYNAEPTGVLAPSEIDDRSDFVATDVADTVDGMLPQIMRIFVGADDAVTFEGRGQPGSEEEAVLATAYVNHLFYVRNDGVGILHDWFKDALLQKVGFVKVWAEEEAEDSRQSYEGQTQEQLAMLMEDGWEPVKAPEVDEDGTLSFTVRKEGRSRCIKVAACAPSEVRVDVNARWGDDPAAIGHVFPRARYLLEQEGYNLSDVGASTSTESDSAMLQELGETDDFSYAPAAPSHETLDYAEVYIKLDRDGDGIAEWLKVCLIGQKIAVYEDGSLAIEQVDDHPFCWICPIPRAHAFFGDCPADRATEPQKLRTRTIRNIEDNMLLSVNQRLYINTRAGVNIDDVLDNRAGGIIRGEDQPGNAIYPIVQPNLGAPAYQFNEYIASWAENRTGFNRYSAGTDQNALNKTARGTELLTAKADMRTELIARFFAVGVRQMFAKMLKLAIQYQNAPEMVKLGNRFVPINPSEFRNQFHVSINVGLGTGSKEQQSARILGLLGIMQQGAAAGVVRPEHLAEAIRLYVQANDFKNPEKFVDPAPQGLPDPMTFKAQQQQQQQLHDQMVEEIRRLEMENEALKLDKANKSADIALKGAQLRLNEQKIVQDGAKAEGDFVLKAQAQELDAMTAAVDALDVAQDNRLEQLEAQVGMLLDLLMGRDAPNPEATF